MMDNYAEASCKKKAGCFLRSSGFTLIEMLVVVAIIGILASMMAPSLVNALAVGKQISCANNIKQLGLGLLTYTSDYNGYMVVSMAPDATSRTGYWSIELAPYIGITGNLDANGFVRYSDVRLVSGIFRCPSFDDDTVLSATGTADAIYCAIGYGWNQQMGLRDQGSPDRMKIQKVIKPSLKVLIGDTTDWMRVSSVEFRTIYPESPYSLPYPNPCIGNRHNQGVNMLLGDGHAEWFLQLDLQMAPSGKSDAKWRFMPYSE